MTEAWLPDISDDDIDVLLEALEAWETKDVAGDIMGDIFSAVLAGKDPAAKAEMENSRRGEKVQRERAKVLRKERSIMLRAKLLTIRERRRVDRVIRDVGRT